MRRTMTYLGIHPGAVRRRRSPNGLTVLALIVGVSPGLSAMEHGCATQGIPVQLTSDGVPSVPASLSSISSGSTFDNFSGSLTVNYKARTAPTGSASVAWAVTNDPVYKTGTYTAVVTFAIAATQRPIRRCP
ncbi:MAG: hypothetical protein JNN08_29525 [Bryobacterales bacterium]|nr:hypothetical protein [Bryobacterales bacterium]